MSSLVRVGCRKGELTRLVARPVGRRDADLERVDAFEVLQGGDPCRHPVTGADPAQQHDDGGAAAGHEQSRRQPADRRGPVGELQQHHAVEDQHQVGNGQQSVALVEPVVGKIADQRQDDQGDRRVERPLAQALRQAALALKPGLDGVVHGRPPTAATTAAATRRPLKQAPADGPLRRIDPQPVQNGEDQRIDAQPLVQAVHLVEPAQPLLGPLRPQRENHRQAHAAHGDDAGVLAHVATPLEQRRSLVEPRFGQKPQQRQDREADPESALDVLHD